MRILSDITNEVVANPGGKRVGSWTPSQVVYAYDEKAACGYKLREGHLRQREPWVGRNPNYNQAEECLKEIRSPPHQFTWSGRIRSSEKTLKSNSV